MADNLPPQSASRLPNTPRTRLASSTSSNESSNAMTAHAGDLRPLAVTFPTAKKITGLGLTTLWKLGKEQRLELVRIGRRTLITYRSIEKILLPEPTPTVRRRGRPRKQPANEATL